MTKSHPHSAVSPDLWVPAHGIWVRNVTSRGHLTETSRMGQPSNAKCPGDPSPPLLYHGLGGWTVNLFSHEFEKKVKWNHVPLWLDSVLSCDYTQPTSFAKAWSAQNTKQDIGYCCYLCDFSAHARQQWGKSQQYSGRDTTWPQSICNPRKGWTCHILHLAEIRGYPESLSGAKLRHRFSSGKLQIGVWPQGPPFPSITMLIFEPPSESKLLTWRGLGVSPPWLTAGHGHLRQENRTMQSQSSYLKEAAAPWIQPAPCQGSDAHTSAWWGISPPHTQRLSPALSPKAKLTTNPAVLPSITSAWAVMLIHQSVF